LVKERGPKKKDFATKISNKRESIWKKKTLPFGAERWESIGGKEVVFQCKSSLFNDSKE
jgi:hypothetical protein